jgi:hypothetical protein
LLLQAVPVRRRACAFHEFMREVPRLGELRGVNRWTCGAHAQAPPVSFDGSRRDITDAMILTGAGARGTQSVGFNRHQLRRMPL